MYKLSVIIPCYNLANYIQDCLSSIVPNLNKEVEYLFIDDGSKDETGIIIKDWIADKKNCHYYYQDNKGVSGARNYGIEISKGEYIYLLDGDDKLFANSISKILSIIDTFSPDIILSGYSTEFLKKINSFSLSIEEKIYPKSELFKLISIFPTQPQLIYKSRIIKENKITFDSNLKLGEVYEFTLRVLLHAKTIYYTKESFFIYVKRSSSASNSINYNNDKTILFTIDKVEQLEPFFKNNNFYNYTAFKIIMAFSYNKYVKGHVSNSEVVNLIRKIHRHQYVRKILKDTIKNKKSNLLDRGLALYYLTTGTKGFKLLSTKSIKINK